ncbi:hypothetical protein Cgig2_024286 [Carnegiea gigantea]|uniref:Uncharacterized protein n=1 Tax=Carnegiea gigantea TaxID=171969 RepID=A0A9Q1JM13_9CARY|nr:hypothetical protein Cgig2_024286 [Carnegiea gigantea]
MKSEKKQRGEKPGETKKEKPKKKAFHKGHIFEVEISDGLDNKESNARDAKSNNEGSDRSPAMPQEEKEPSNKSRIKLQHKERHEKGEETKKQEPKKKPITDILTHEHEEADHNANEKEGEEETPIHVGLKAVPKVKKPVLKFEGKQAIEQKDTQLSTGAALLEEEISSSGQDVQIASQEQPLNYESGGNEKRMYQKAFIMRMSIRSFSLMVAQQNEAQTKAVR